MDQDLPSPAELGSLGGTIEAFTLSQSSSTTRTGLDGANEGQGLRAELNCRSEAVAPPAARAG
jgi:hypothetical protein